MLQTYTMLITITIVAFTAFWHTAQKERIMIQEGGQPLPTSSYVFLGVKYLTEIGFVFIIGTVFEPKNPTYLMIILFTAGTLFSAQILSKVVEVLIRVGISVFYTRKVMKEIKELKKKTEKEA